MKQIAWLVVLLIGVQVADAQTIISGIIRSAGRPLEFATVGINGTTIGTTTNAAGKYSLDVKHAGQYQINISSVGYENETKTITAIANAEVKMDVDLVPATQKIEEVVITGTMKAVSKLESPVPVEVYTKDFFKRNPAPSLFDGLQNINGVRPQLNCNICNTGDIHINGLEGPYTMVLIDGMPIVSGLSTVYGLSGIPSALVDRIEIVKGPASTLYGSEAVGGLINVITKSPSKAPLLSADVFATNWGELNADIGSRIRAGNKATSLLGVNYYNYSNPIDKNGDNFTDVTLQNRISLFNKWSINRKANRILSIGGRYVYEDRWGGDMRFAKQFRGTDSIYGESIYTNRWELTGLYELPTQEKLVFSFSVNGHYQNSYYGTMGYMAAQQIGFGQLTWNKALGRSHDLLSGIALRYTAYDDNTTATADYTTGNNQPSLTWLPGLFVQDEWTLNDQNKLLLGARYDYNSLHGSIITPRINYKWSSPTKTDVLRLSIGNGYRVANVFTEDHAALTGARKVEFTESLKPERSWNSNLNYVRKMMAGNRTYINLDATAFYTYFSNKIIPDYDTDPNKIIYGNLDGYAVSQGVSLNVDVTVGNNLKGLVGITAMDVYNKAPDANGKQKKTYPVLTEKYNAIWSISYTINKIGLVLDYTGNLYGPMRLPLLGDKDPRAPYSPWWSLQNIQLTKVLPKGWEIYGGVKNLLNYTPPANSIARANDPFDKNVTYDNNGNVLATPQNPYALTFDPAYVFAPNQGIRYFIGLRYTATH